MMSVVLETFAAGLELIAAAAVILGAAAALVGGAKGVRNDPSGMWKRGVWLHFAAWIILGLEFALGADIIRTIVAPTWDDLGKLAVLAAIRTALNYFLSRDLGEFHPVEGAAAPASGTDRRRLGSRTDRQGQSAPAPCPGEDGRSS